MRIISLLGITSLGTVALVGATLAADMSGADIKAQISGNAVQRLEGETKQPVHAMG